MSLKRGQMTLKDKFKGERTRPDQTNPCDIDPTALHSLFEVEYTETEEENSFSNPFNAEHSPS